MVPELMVNKHKTNPKGIAPIVSSKIITKRSISIRPHKQALLFQVFDVSNMVSPWIARYF